MDQLLNKAHETDPSTTKIMKYLRRERCLHCGERYDIGIPITYTLLSGFKIIWWHRSHNIKDFDD